MTTWTASIVDNSLSKGRRITLYVLIAAISLFYLFIGGQKVLGAEQMLARMAEMHYPPWATRLIGVVEVAAVAGLWWRRTRTAALSALILIMAGAAGSHVAFGHATEPLVVAGIAGVLGATLFVDRGRGLWHFLLQSRPSPRSSAGDRRGAERSTHETQAA